MSASGGRGILYDAIFHASASGAVDRTAQDKLGEIISVKDFGAKGDGISDDTNAFQQAITTALVTGASVYIPGSATAYIISAKVTCGGNIRIWGEGRFSVIRPTITNGDPVLYFPPQSDYFSVYNFSIISNINTTNFAAGSAQAQQCTGLMVDSDAGNSLYSSRFNIHNLNCAGLKVGIDIYGFTADVFNTWCQFNEIGFRGNLMNSSELKLRLEDNRQDLVITNSNAILFNQLLIEGDNALPVSSTIDSSTNVVMVAPYFEQAAPARNVPFLTIGGSSQVNQFQMISGRVNGSSGMTTGTYPIALDQVVGATVDIYGADGSQCRKVSTTANTKDYRLTGSAAFDAFHDGSNQLGAPYNYWPNPQFDLWFRGWKLTGGQSVTRCTMTQETTIVRKGANAMRLTCTAGQTQSHSDFDINGDVVTALRGKAVRVGVWMWVPNIAAYDESNRVLFPAIQITTVGGGTVSSTGNNAVMARNAWNFYSEEVTIGAAATDIQVQIWPNKSNTAAGGTEYVVVDSITVVESSCPVSKQMNGDLTDSPLIPAIGMGSRMIASSTTIPTDANQVFVQGDVVWNRSATASGSPGWICTTGGSPGTWSTLAAAGAPTGRVVVAYVSGGNYTPTTLTQVLFTLTIGDGGGFAFNSPSNSSQDGMLMTLWVSNTGTMGTINLGGAYHCATGTTTLFNGTYLAPANGFNKSVVLQFNASKAIWFEVSRSITDMVN